LRIVRWGADTSQDGLAPISRATPVINQRRAEEIVSRVYSEHVDWLPLDRAVEQFRDTRESLHAAGVTDAELLELAYVTVWRILHDRAVVAASGARHVLVEALCLAYGVEVEYWFQQGRPCRFRLRPLPREMD
jgi:hypothetical protein